MVAALRGLSQALKRTMCRIIALAITASSLVPKPLL